MTQGVKLAENISGVEIANIIKSKNSEIGNVNNLNIFIDALIQRMTKLHDEARKHNEEGIFPDIPKTNEGFANMFIESFNKAKKIINDPLNHEALKNHMGRELTDEEVLKLTIFIAGNILLYGENGIAAVKGSFGLLPNDNTFNSVLSTVNQRISFYFTTIYDLKEVWENIQGKLKNSFDPVDAVALLTLKTEEKKREKIEYVPKKITEHEEKEVSPPVKHKKPSVKEKPKKEETTETKAPISEELANETIEQMYIIENYLTPSQLADLGYLQNTQDLVRIYSDTDLIFSPGMIAGFEKQLEEKGLSPQGEGVFGRVGLNKYHLEEAVLYATGYLEELWGVPNLVLWENDDERKALQQLIINLGIYDYMNGKGELKELFDGATGDELRKVFSNGRINMDALNDINKRVLNAVPEQQQFVMFIANQIFSDEEKNRTSVIREYNQLAVNTDAMETLNLYPTEKDLELVSGGRPLIYNKDENQIYALTEERKTLFSENATALGLNEITWDEFVRRYKQYYGYESPSNMLSAYNILNYGNTPINKGGHGEYATIGGDILLNYTNKGNPYLQGTNIIKKHWKEATKGLGDKWDGSVSMIGEWILQNVKLNKADRTELENAVIFYKAVEKNEINNYTWEKQKTNTSPINDLYYNAANYTEKWQDFFDEGLFNLAEEMGWVKIEKNEKGEWVKVKVINEKELNNVLSDTSYMVYFAYAYTVLGPNAAIALHERYGKEWVKKLKNEKGSKEIKNFLTGKFGRRYGASRRVNNYKKGAEKLTGFMNALQKELKKKNLTLDDWATLTNKMKTDTDLRNTVVNKIVEFLEETDYTSRSLFFPLYFRFYNYDKEGNIIGVKRDVVEKEIMKCLDVTVTDGLNPAITLGFLITSNTYENDFTPRYHEKKPGTYVPHFSLAGPNKKIIYEATNFDKRIGFDGILNVEESEDVTVGWGVGPKLKWRNIEERELVASMDENIDIMEISIKDREKKNDVTGYIRGQALLQVIAQHTAMKDEERGSEVIRTPNVKGMKVTLYFSRVEKDGSLTRINVPVEGELTTDENGRIMVKINLNQRDKNDKFIFEDGKEYVISGFTERDDLGVTPLEHIATFRIKEYSEISPTVKAGPTGPVGYYKLEPVVADVTVISGVGTSLTAQNLVWNSWGAKLLYNALNKVGTLESTTTEPNGSITHVFSYTNQNGENVKIKINYNGTNYSVTGIQINGSSCDSSASDTYGQFSGTVTSDIFAKLANNWVNFEDREALDLMTHFFINEDNSFTPGFGTNLSGVGVPTIYTDFRSELANAFTKDNIWYYNPDTHLFSEGAPHIIETIGGTIGMVFNSSRVNVKVRTDVSRVNNFVFSLPLLEKIKNGGNVDIDVTLVYDKEDSTLYLTSDETELPEELKKGEYVIEHHVISFGGQFKITGRFGTGTGIILDVPTATRKELYTESTDVIGHLQAAAKGFETGYSIGLQQIISYVLGEGKNKVKPFVAGEINYVKLPTEAFPVVGAGGGAEIYWHDMKITAAVMTRKGLKGSEEKYTNIDAHTFTFSVEKDIDKKYLNKLALNTAIEARQTFTTGKVYAVGRTGPFEGRLGVTATKPREGKPRAGVVVGAGVSLEWIWRNIMYPPLDWLGVF